MKTNGKTPYLKRMKVSELKPANYNPRTITLEAIGRLTKSMAEFGNLQPIVWNSRSKTLVAGHQRLKVMLARGDKETDVWVVDLDREREKLANIQLNTAAGDWDGTQLGDLLKKLKAEEKDLDLTGLDQTEIDKLLKDLEVPDEFAEVGEDVATAYCCPKCKYTWSGKAG